MEVSEVWQTEGTLNSSFWSVLHSGMAARCPGETTGPWQPGLAMCELIDSQLYQQPYEKYGFCDDHNFLGVIFKTKVLVT